MYGVAWPWSRGAQILSFWCCDYITAALWLIIPPLWNKEDNCAFTGPGASGLCSPRTQCSLVSSIVWSEVLLDTSGEPYLSSSLGPLLSTLAFPGDPAWGRHLPPVLCFHCHPSFRYSTQAGVWACGSAQSPTRLAFPELWTLESCPGLRWPALFYLINDLHQILS
jgi:hypothetical protein